MNIVTTKEITQDNPQEKVLNLLSKDLDKRANYMLITAFLVLLMSFSLATYLYIDIKNVIDNQVTKIQSSQPGQQALLVTVYLLFRILTLGGIVTALLIFGYNVIKASLDQSVRFAKRKHGALFLEFLHAEYGSRINDVSFDKFKEAFEAWNKTTESSFTNLKISNKNFFATSLENLSSSLREIKEKLPKQQA